MARGRPSGRGLPSGDQGQARADPRAALRDGRLLVLLARGGRLLRRGAPPSKGTLRGAADLRPSRLRLRDAHRHGGHRRFDDRLRVRAQRREGLRRQAAVPRRPLRLGGGGPRGRAPAGGRRRSERRAHGPGRAPEGAQARRRRPAGGRARPPARADRPGPGGRGPGDGPRQRRPLHVVGALAQPPPAQHRLEDRLPPGERGPGRRRPSNPWSGRRWGRATTPPWS